MKTLLISAPHNTSQEKFENLLKKYENIKHEDIKISSYGIDIVINFEDSLPIEELEKILIDALKDE